MKMMEVMGQLDPERESLPLNFHPKYGKLIDGVDPCWLGRALRAQQEKNSSTPAWSFWESGNWTLFNEESGHLVVTAKGNQPQAESQKQQDNRNCMEQTA